MQTAVSEYKQDISNAEIEERIKDRMLGLDTKETEKDEALVSANNNSSSKLLENKNTSSAGSTSQPTNVFRKRTISNSKENRLSQEVYELVDLQSKEELQTNIEIPPKK